jgi:hypothetical protein
MISRDQIYISESKSYYSYSKYSGPLTSTLKGNESDTSVNVPTFSHPNPCPNHPGPKNTFIERKKIMNAARI